MPDDMLEDAISIAKAAMDEYQFEPDGTEVSSLITAKLVLKQIAKKVKLHMDKKWEPSWHVFLGKSFGCHAVHERNRFVYFTFEASKISFLIYKAS